MSRIERERAVRNTFRDKFEINPCAAPPGATAVEMHYSYPDYTDKGLYRVPRKKVKNHANLHLNLGNNRITVLKEGMLSDVSKAVAICLNNNKIKRIENNTFKMMIYLKHLDLMSNKITDIDAGMWQGLTQLESLDLTLNRIKQIPDESFSMLKNLTKLSLQLNKISTISSTTFANLYKLDKIELQFNNIKSIGPRAFSSLKNLSKVCLQHNRLSGLSSEMFAKSHLMAEFNLAFNRFQSFANALKYVGGIISLHIGCNKLSNMTLQKLPKMPNLLSINLDSNGINQIKDGTFSLLHNLLNLSLAMNLISDLSPGMWQGLHRLEKLDLDCNKISSIPYAAFSSINNCRIINLYGNRITHFAPGALAGLFELDTIDLTRNNLHALNPSMLDPSLHVLFQQKSNTLVVEIRPYYFSEDLQGQCYFLCLCIMRNATHYPSKLMISGTISHSCCKRTEWVSRSHSTKRYWYAKRYVDNITCSRREDTKESTVPPLVTVFTNSHATTKVIYDKTSRHHELEFGVRLVEDHNKQEFWKNNADIVATTTLKDEAEDKKKKRDQMVTRYIVISLGVLFGLATIIGIFVAQTLVQKWRRDMERRVQNRQNKFPNMPNRVQNTQDRAQDGVDMVDLQ